MFWSFMKESLFVNLFKQFLEEGSRTFLLDAFIFVQEIMGKYQEYKYIRVCPEIRIGGLSSNQVFDFRADCSSSNKRKRTYEQIEEWPHLNPSERESLSMYLTKTLRFLQISSLCLDTTKLPQHDSHIHSSNQFNSNKSSQATLLQQNSIRGRTWNSSSKMCSSSNQENFFKTPFSNRKGRIHKNINTKSLQNGPFLQNKKQFQFKDEESNNDLESSFPTPPRSLTHIQSYNQQNTVSSYNTIPFDPNVSLSIFKNYPTFSFSQQSPHSSSTTTTTTTTTATTVNQRSPRGATRANPATSLQFRSHSNSYSAIGTSFHSPYSQYSFSSSFPPSLYNRVPPSSPVSQILITYPPPVLPKVLPILLVTSLLQVLNQPSPNSVVSFEDLKQTHILFGKELEKIFDTEFRRHLLFFQFLSSRQSNQTIPFSGQRDYLDTRFFCDTYIQNTPLIMSNTILQASFPSFVDQFFEF